MAHSGPVHVTNRPLAPSRQGLPSPPSPRAHGGSALTAWAIARPVSVFQNIPASVLQPRPQGVGEKAGLAVALTPGCSLGPRVLTLAGRRLGRCGRAPRVPAGADVAPLQEYMDPMNEYNALNEAKQMIAIADENQNQHLEPEEVLKYSEFFTGSKLVDYARSVHEEF